MAKTIYSKIIPFRGFTALNLFGVIFIRKDAGLTDAQLSKVLAHEAIHTAQMKELLYVFFYIAYFFEWLVRLFTDTKTAYRSISFEKEAYAHQSDTGYLDIRKPYAQWRKDA